MRFRQQSTFFFDEPVFREFPLALRALSFALEGTPLNEHTAIALRWGWTTQSGDFIF